jgi:two-component system, OmpR family, phosphate regulon sensor histidine kinase PhoR
VTSTRAPGTGKTSRLAPGELAAVLDHLPGGVIVVDSGRVVRYRNLAAQLICHPEPLLIGAPVPDLGWQPPIDQVLERLSRHRVIRELELRAGDRTFLLSGRLPGDTRLALLQITDVTTRARRFYSEERFTSDAAHEILGPLTAIAGAAQVLQESAKDDPQARDRFIGHIADGTERLISIAMALLVLARAESGDQAPRLELVPVRPLLEDVVGHQADVTLECAANVGVLAEPDLLRQALATLLDNARRHAREGIAVAVAEADGTVSIDILDTGSGILPEHLERVTERFYSAAGRDSGGYGIGLSIAARAAKVLGGTLDLASSRSGTRARLRLPSARIL